MSGWHRLNLGDAMLAFTALQDIEARVTHSPELLINGAIATRHESEGSLHCELLLYFTPECTALARVLGAEPCAPPNLQGLSLLHGSSPYLTQHDPR